MFDMNKTGECSVAPPGKCRGTECREGGVPDHSGGSG